MYYGCSVVFHHHTFYVNPTIFNIALEPTYNCRVQRAKFAVIARAKKEEAVPMMQKSR